MERRHSVWIGNAFRALIHSQTCEQEDIRAPKEFVEVVFMLFEEFAGFISKSCEHVHALMAGRPLIECWQRCSCIKWPDSLAIGHEIPLVIAAVATRRYEPIRHSLKSLRPGFQRNCLAFSSRDGSSRSSFMRLPRLCTQPSWTRKVSTWLSLSSVPSSGAAAPPPPLDSTVAGRSIRRDPDFANRVLFEC